MAEPCPLASVELVVASLAFISSILVLGGWFILRRRSAAAEGTRPSLRELLKVTSGAYQMWQGHCRKHLGRIRAAGLQIMNRRLREDVFRLARVIDEIVQNCDKDPDDIRAETGLPAILNQVAGAIEEYVRAAGCGHPHPNVSAQLARVEAMVSEAIPKLRDLLDRMRRNDGLDAELRARLVSAVFGNMGTQNPESSGTVSPENREKGTSNVRQ